MRIFIAGCARSGTTLLAELMVSFRDSCLLRAEKHFDHFSKLDRPETNVILKRTRDTHMSLHRLPSDIGLIYSVRHPFDTLTSRHPRHPERNYYVTPSRWSAEYASLKTLRKVQPERSIVYVRYDDIVRSPDTVQENIARAFGLEVDQSFSQCGIPISAASIEKFRGNEKMEFYLNSFSQSFRAELSEYCAEFGYELPKGYLKAESPLAAEIADIVAGYRRRERR